MDWSPHIVVAAVVEREGRYLLVEEEIEGERVFNQPAGHWERGETLIEGVIRETLEESAWDIEPTGFLGLYLWQAPTLPYPFVRVAFTGRALQHHPDRKLDAGIARAVWMTPEEIAAAKDRHRSPSVAACIADHRAGRIYPLSAIRQLHPDS
jgi:ADP-ribose pyrophosphatase YjhB (NUDIX family)